MSAVLSKAAEAMMASRLPDAAAVSYRAPLRMADTGIDQSMLVDLASKLLLTRGRLRLLDLVEQMKLSASIIEELLQAMRQDGLIEINRQGSSDLGLDGRLTDAGRVRAQDALKRNRYVGPAPVSLDAFTAMIRQQASQTPSINRALVLAAFSDLVIPSDLLDRLGAAMNSRRAILLYGQPGSGKSFLGHQLSRLLPGSSYIPYAIAIGGEIVQVFDPYIHQPITAESESAQASRAGASRGDHRWVNCQRPVVVAGGELTLEMLDLRFDATLGFYQAPPHVKALGGLFMIDDLGRQLVSSRDLMNRWIVPLERGVDYLSTHTGLKFEVPFEMTVVFSTNFVPTELADEAFLRRFGHKIHIGAVSPRDYKRLFEKACSELQVTFSIDAFEWLIVERHARLKRPMLAAYPRDLVGRVRDLALYYGQNPAMSAETLDHAWQTYFLVNSDPDVDSNTFGVA